MKTCQNRLRRLVVFIGLVASLASFGLTSALAQKTATIANKGPVNLLGLSPPENTSNGNAQGASEGLTIENAFNVVTDNEAAGSTIDQSTQQAVAINDAAARNVEAKTEATVKENATAVEAEQSSVLGKPTVTIGLRDVEDVGLAAIGIRQSADGAENLNELIWRGTAASRATFLYENGSLAPQSRAISSLTLEVVARKRSHRLAQTRWRVRLYGRGLTGWQQLAGPMTWPFWWGVCLMMMTGLTGKNG